MIKNANKLNLNNSNLDYNTMNISSLDEGVADTSRVISTSRKHKKQDTTHFNEYKKGNKSTKKEEKETRDNLKVKIGVLADKLYRTKKITKALYNKMYNVSMGAGRLNTLTTTYQNLRGFKHAETTVKKNQFNQTLKQTKEGKKTLNTVYIKYEVHEKIDKQVIVKVKNYTLTVTGDESDIRKEIKNSLHL